MGDENCFELVLMERLSFMSWEKRIHSIQQVFSSPIHVKNKEAIVIKWVVDHLHESNMLVTDQNITTELWRCLLNFMKCISKNSAYHLKHVGHDSVKLFLIAQLEAVQIHSDMRVATNLVELISVIVSNEFFIDVSAENFKFLCTLASGILGVLHTSFLNHPEVHKKFQEILKCIFLKFVSFEGFLNRKTEWCLDTVCSTFFRPAVLLILSPLEKNGLISQELQNAIISTIENMISMCSRDFDAFLKKVFSDGKLSCSPSIVKFLTFIQKFVTENVSEKLCGFLLQIVFRGYCHTKVGNMHLNLLVVLCQMIGIEMTFLNERGIKNVDLFLISFDGKSRLMHLAVLLEEVCRVKDKTVLKKTRQVSITDFCHCLARFLLDKVENRGCFWYNSLSSLISIDIHALSKNDTVQCMDNLCLDYYDLDVADKVSQERFICILLDNLVKTKLIENVLFEFVRRFDVVSLSDSSKIDILPPAFVNKLGEVCVAFYPDVFVSIFLDFVGLLSSHMDVHKDKKKELYIYRHVIAMQILEVVLKNVWFAGRDVPSVTLNKFKNESLTASKDCFRQLLENAVLIKDVRLLLSTLKLIYCWGELHMLMMYHNNDYKSHCLKSNTTGIECPASSVDYIADKEWDSVFEITTTLDNGALKRVLILLLLQKMKAVTLFSHDFVEDTGKELQAVVHVIFVLFDIKSGNVDPEVWETICQNLYLYLPYLEQEHVDLISTAIVAHTSIGALEVFENGKPGPIKKKLHDITMSMLCSSNFQEMRSCHTSLIINVIMEITAKVLFPQSIMNVLEHWTKSCMDFITSEKLRPTEFIKQCDIKLIQATENLFSQVFLTNEKCSQQQLLDISGYLFVLQHLPLDSILPFGQMCCFIVVVSVLRVAETNEKSDIESVVELSSLRIATALLNGDKTVLIYLLLKVDNFLFVIVQLSKQLLQKVYGSLLDGKRDENVQEMILCFIDHIWSIIVQNSFPSSIFEAFFDEIKELLQSPSIEPSLEYFSVKLLVMLLRPFCNIGDDFMLADHHNKCRKRLMECIIVHYTTLNEQTNIFEMDSPFLPLVVPFYETFSLLLRLHGNYGQKELLKNYNVRIRKALSPLSVLFGSNEIQDRNRETCHDILCIVIDNLQVFERYLPTDIVLMVWNAIDAYAPECTLLISSSKVKEAAKKLVECCSHADFDKLLTSICDQMIIDKLTDFGFKKVNIAIWKLHSIISCRLSQEKSTLFKKKMDEFLSIWQASILHSDPNLCVLIVQIEAELLRIKTALSVEQIQLILHGCVMINVCTIETHATFVRCFTALCTLLKYVFTNYEQMIVSFVPSIMSVVNHLISAVFLKGNDESVKLCQTNEIQDICYCAQKLRRLFCDVARCKNEFSKVVFYILANFVSASTKSCLYPPVKDALIVGIYEVLKSCNENQLMSYIAIWSLGEQAIFADLQENYKKYYQFTGFI